MVYETERLRLCMPELDFSKSLRNYLTRNNQFLEEWEPKRSPEYFQEENIDALLTAQIREIREKSGLYFYLFQIDHKDIIGTIGFSNIVYGPFQSCFLGYRLSREHINVGYMTEGLRKAIDLCFGEYKLHRIEANVIPRNLRSKKVLEKLHFAYEGLSKKYLKINGVWEDHERYVLLNEAVE